MKKISIIICLILGLSGCSQDLAEITQPALTDSSHEQNPETLKSEVIAEDSKNMELTSTTDDHGLWNSDFGYVASVNFLDYLELRDYNNHCTVVCVPGDHIFPIGWSTDGKFAYMLLNIYEDAIGGSDFKFVIVDTVTDQIVWEQGWNLLDNLNITLEEPLVSPNDYWVEHKEEIEAKLDENGIIMQDNFELYKFPSDQLDVLTEIVTKKIDHELEILDVKVYLDKTDNNQKKIIYHEEAPESGLLTVKAEGYIKSPFQNRILVFISHEYKGWEGPPNPIRFQLIGSNLQVGFEYIDT